MANPHPFAILKQKKPDSGIPHVSLAQRDLVLVVMMIRRLAPNVVQASASTNGIVPSARRLKPVERVREGWWGSYNEIHSHYVNSRRKRPVVEMRLARLLRHRRSRVGRIRLRRPAQRRNGD